MKKITLLLVIIFTFLFTNTSWGEWSFVGGYDSGTKVYYDKDRVRKSGKSLYLWELTDYLKPIGKGVFSTTKYVQLDCSIFRYKILRIQSYKNSMGEGKIKMEWTPKGEQGEWYYPKPNSSSEFMYNKVCEEHQ